MLNPWNNSVAQKTLDHIRRLLPGCSTPPWKYWWFRQSESVRACFFFSKEQLQCCSCERIGEDMCNVCERMSVEREPASSVPAPYLSSSLRPTHPSLPSASATLFSFSHSPSLMSFHLCYVSHFIFTHTHTHTKQTKHTLCARCLTQVQTHTPTVCPLPLSLSLFCPLSPPVFSLILSQLYRCLMLSPCCRERTEHLSSSGGMVVRVGGVGGCEPHAFLCSRTLVPLGWKDASRLGIKPWPSARQQASTAPSLHHQIWATSMWAGSRLASFFCFFLCCCCCCYLICCLFLRVCCWWAEKDVEEETEERNMPVSEIPAEPPWPKGDVCQSDFRRI